MLLSRDIKPTNNIYFNGAIVLKVIENIKSNSIEFLELYELVKARHTMSLQTFILSIDWLFLLGSIKTNRQGEIEKCF